MVDVEMRSNANFSQVSESKGQKAISVAKSMMQSVCNHAYSTKALKKLSKSILVKSKKTNVPMSWVDGVVGSWAME